MSKVVAGKSPKQHYTPVSNALIRNPEIDDGTFRLICWMTSHVEGWEVNFASIQKALSYGRDKLRKILKTAENQNYLVRRKIRVEGGLFDFEYHIFKDTEDAIAFRESLPQEELTSDVFSGGGSTRGGSTRGGSARGGESDPHKEEQYRENQIKEEKRGEDTPTPQSDFVSDELKNSEQIEVEKLKPEPITQEQEQDKNPKPQQLTFLLNQSESLAQTDDPNSESKVPSKFDNLEQSNKLARTEKRMVKVSDEEICRLFLEAYNAHKPSNFTEHTKINPEHLKKIKHLLKDFPDTAIEIFVSALTWVREQSDSWWRQKQFSLNNLMTNGKILDYADKHITAMKYDASYRLRVEGRAPSMDLKRMLPNVEGISQAQYEDVFARQQQLDRISKASSTKFEL
ncbi:hypothetical protein WKK05_37420 (plasmid) [Nostoc sp. UHCC 0302]|uniref:hypothetical protein n=1 Tax=Nostoc sp. UHCC 0302 TaxID=3134896 RepID=UPI00311CAECE